MLVLSRKSSEVIHIGDSIAITVVRIGPYTVRLGIDAPRDMVIVRDELVRALEAQGVTVTVETNSNEGLPS